jgi:penicillin-binding protein 2
MKRPTPKLTDMGQRQDVFSRRAFLMGGAVGAGLLTLGGRLVHLQIINTRRYETLADSNQFDYRLTPPPRGLIVDRNGVVLASNRPNFRLLLAREEHMDVPALLERLSELIPLDEARRRRLTREIMASPRRVPVSVMEDMTWEQFSRVNVRAPELPGVTADMGEVRVYPYGGAYAHVIGYVAKVTAEDVRRAGPNPEPILMHPGFRIGKQGVEKSLDRDLRGRPGAVKVEVDANGRVVREDPAGNIPSTPGSEVKLTLDSDIQNRALEVFDENSGAAVMVDCRSGDILCMVSAPSFDANIFVRGATGPEYRALANYERRPLLDKALTGTYPPGSTFKTMTALAALEAGVDPNVRINCGGGMRFGGRVFHCWNHRGHGPQTMHDAIKNSCDIYFYTVAARIGPDIIARTARAFGLGQTFDIGIGGQRAGVVPDQAWKRHYFRRTPANQPWFPGESLSYGIGQGYLNVNGLQLAVMTARLANARKAIQPRLIHSVGGVERPSGAAAPDLPFPHEHLHVVREAMASVANDVGGGAYRQSQLGLGDVKMAGKTGTAQVRSFDTGSRSDAGMPWRLKAHNLFVAFAPYDDPRYAISVIVQHGGGSGATIAAPIAREVMKVALLKDPEVVRRIEQPLRMAAAASARGPQRMAPEPDPTSVVPPVTDAATGAAIPQPAAPPDLPETPPQEFEH